MKVICIDGCVGCGKTTLINTLYEMLSKRYKVHVIHEYIDVLSDAQQKLTDYLSGVITASEFQRYILNYYASNTYLINDYDYVLVERIPIVGLQFFGKLDVKNKRLTIDEYNELVTYAKRLTFYPDPTDSKCNTISICTDYMDPSTVADLSYQLITDNVTDVIMLTATAPTIKQRIIQRGRQCEIEAYTDEYIQYMCQEYYN